jgi:predicted RNase H-like HicB family nuclease
MARPIVIRADWDPEAEVWVAESPDLPALVTEAESIEELRAKLKVILPDIIDVDAPGTQLIDFDVIAYVRDRLVAGEAAE